MEMDNRRRRYRLMGSQQNLEEKKFGTDPLAFNYRNYMVTLNYFLEVGYLEDIQTITVIRKLKAHFAKYT